MLLWNTEVVQGSLLGGGGHHHHHDDGNHDHNHGNHDNHNHNHTMTNGNHDHNHGNHDHNQDNHEHEHHPDMNQVDEKPVTERIQIIKKPPKNRKKGNRNRGGRRFGKNRNQNSVIPFNFRIPKTSFSCKGRAPGYYADMEAECKV